MNQVGSWYLHVRYRHVLLVAALSYTFLVSPVKRPKSSRFCLEYNRQAIRKTQNYAIADEYHNILSVRAKLSQISSLYVQ